MAKKNMKPNYTNISAVFPNGLNCNVSINAEYIMKNDNIYRGYPLYIFYGIRWYIINELGECNVAMMRIRTMLMDSLEYGIEMADEIDGDLYSTLECVHIYAKKKSLYNWLLDEIDVDDKAIRDKIDFFNPVHFCEIQNFYISPEYRRKGLASALILQLPKILLDFGIYESDACFGIYINPFNTNESLSAIDDPIEWAYKQKYMDDSADKDKIIKIMEKPLLKCGFEKIVENYYMTHMKTLRDKTGSDGFDYILEFAD